MPLTRLPLTTGVSGTLPIANGGTNVTSAADLANTGNLVKLEDINVSSAVSAVEINLDYSGYTAFKLIIDKLDKSGTSSSNILFRVKRDGQSSFDSGSNTYGAQGILYDTAATRNNNNNASSIPLLTSTGTGVFTMRIEALITGAQETDVQFQMQGVVSIAENGGSTSTSGFGGTRYNNTEKVTDLQITDTVQNIGTCRGALYGVKS